MYRYIIFLALASLLSGCASVQLPYNVGACTNKTLPNLLDATDLKELFQSIAAELCMDKSADNTQNPVDEKGAEKSCSNQDSYSNAAVLVTDFADLQSFLPNQSGLLMGELMRGSLSSVCHNKIVQAEFAKYFKLSETGLVVLTRKVSEIKKDEYSQAEAIIGTYSYLNNNKVVIFVRKLNIDTGTISRMVAREINYSCSGRSVDTYSVK